MIPASWAQFMYRFGVWAKVLLKPKFEPKRPAPRDVQRAFCTVRPALLDVQRAVRTVRPALLDVQRAFCTVRRDLRINCFFEPKIHKLGPNFHYSWDPVYV